MKMTVTRENYILSSGDATTGESIANYTLRFRDIEEAKRPRERLLAQGPEHLSTAELVAVIWGMGTRKEDVLNMSRRTTREYGEQTLLLERNPKKLASALEIPLQKAMQLVAAFELGRRAYERRDGLPVYIKNVDQAYDHLRTMGTCRKEQLRGLYLNSRYQLIHDEVISVGSLTANIVHPREVFQPAIEYGAVAIVLAHNHPSGSLTPTTEDIQVTGQLAAAGKMLGIELVDHVIISELGYKSIL